MIELIQLAKIPPNPLSYPQLFSADLRDLQKNNQFQQKIDE